MSADGGIVSRRMIEAVRRHLALREGRIHGDAYVIAFCVGLQLCAFRTWLKKWRDSDHLQERGRCRISTA